MGRGDGLGKSDRVTTIEYMVLIPFFFSLLLFLECLPVAIHTKSYQLPYNSCRNVHVLQNLPPNTSHTPATILSCLLDKALVLTSDNLHLIFHPLFSPLPVLQPPGGTFQNHSHGRHLYRVFIYIYSLLIKKGICDR
jgi:hypothetical protein